MGGRHREGGVRKREREEGGLEGDMEGDKTMNLEGREGRY